MPWINVDFYSAIDANNTHADLTAILRNVGDLSPQQRLINRNPEHADYIELIDVSHGQTFGGAARIRRMGLPSRFNLRTIRRLDLGLSDDEGLEEIAFFVYDDRLKTLALQRHRLFRSPSFERLVKELSGAAFHLEPKMRKDQWSRFKRFRRIGSLEISIFGPDHHPDFSDVQPSLGRMLNESRDQANAMRVDLKMSMAGSRKESLNLEWARKLVSLLRKEENVKELKASGTYADTEESDVINFMRDRLAFSAEVEYSTRSLGDEACRRLLRQAIEQNREYLNSLL